MNKSSFIAVPLPLINVHEGGVTFCLKDWNLLLLLAAVFALGWIGSRIIGRYSEEK
jgi:hypothetical protein